MEEKPRRIAPIAEEDPSRAVYDSLLPVTHHKHGGGEADTEGEGDGGAVAALFSHKTLAKLGTGLICLGLIVVIITAAVLFVQDHSHSGSPVNPDCADDDVNDLSQASNSQPVSVPWEALNPQYYRPPSKEPSLFQNRNGERAYQWSPSMAKALRTAFHFQPRKNWMNDPNAPLYYKGWYHLFYQYNPDEAFWGLISWGHAVSSDLIHWLYLDIVMEPDRWYDANGVWTGSATFVNNGVPTVVYTGSTNESVQVQNIAVPTDPEDPLLRNWSKGAHNPILVPPSGIAVTDFRDPTTAWLGDDGLWRMALGSRLENRTGIALLYQSPDFNTHWNLQDHYLYSVDGTGMWECVDFYPVAASGALAGLDTSVHGEGVKHVIKASMDETRLDFYTIGTYDAQTHTFTADDPSAALGYGRLYDYGKFYASKTFFDQKRGRRILWGWLNESDSLQDDIKKGWASIQSLPRQVWFDNLTKSNLIQWPVEELSELRGKSISKSNVTLESGSVLKVDGISGSQLDIELSFVNPLKQYAGKDIYSQGLFGPFGILVLASDNLTEQTAVFFFLSYEDGNWVTRVSNDQSKSSLATDVDKRVHGGKVTVLDDEDLLSLRVVVDRSIVETFAQGGRTCVSSRVYPTEALDESAHLFMFNNGTDPVILKHLEVWQINKVRMRPFFC